MLIKLAIEPDMIPICTFVYVYHPTLLHIHTFIDYIFKRYRIMKRTRYTAALTHCTVSTIPIDAFIFRIIVLIDALQQQASSSISISNTCTCMYLLSKYIIY